jgi:membrane-bound serine protease (ClpP class)
MNISGHYVSIVMRRLPRLAALLLLACAASLSATAANGNGRALVLEVADAIGPATSDFLRRGIDAAAENDAELVIIVLDTPGGLDSSMRDIIKAILASPVPVATFVYPSGSRAASAGTYILYASHIAAMAPATNLGAATPVPIGGKPDTGKDGSDDQDEENGKTDPGSAMNRKAVNDAIAYIRSLAELRGRNAEWAEIAVREGESLSAEAALETGVIDVMADDIPGLLKAINGRTVTTEFGEVTLATESLIVEKRTPDWRTELLSVITNPSIAYLLLLVGIYGLIFEGYNPGAIVPGVVGAICLLLAAYALQLLPVNYAGLGLIALGVVLMIAELFAPSFGALGIGGIIAFVIGSVILIDTDVPGFRISLSLIFSMAIAGAVLVFAILAVAIKARRAPVVTGREELIGGVGEARSDIAEHGSVWVHSELWNARSATPLKAGDKVRIIDIDGLTLVVEHFNKEG